VLALQERMGAAGPDTPWKVRDYVEVLRDARAIHVALVKREEEREDDDGD